MVSMMKGMIIMEYRMNETGFVGDYEFGALNISSNDEFGYRPFALMVSSIVGCSGGLLRTVLNKMRINFVDMIINADVKRNPDMANRIEEINLKFTIFGKDIPEKKVAKALEVSRKNCAMIQSVKDSITIKETFEIMESSK